MANISSTQERFFTPNPVAKYVKEELKALRIRLNTCIPAIIQSYDVKTNRAVVLPIYKIKLREEVDLGGVTTDEIPISPLSNVPVLFFGGSNLRVSFEPKKDDKGLLLFSQRSLDDWKAFLIENALPKQHYPKINRTFDLNDGVFLPSVIDKFPPRSAATAGAGGGGLLDSLLGVAGRLTGLDSVSQSLESVGSEIKSLSDRKSELERERGSASRSRRDDINSQISDLNSQISLKTDENNSLLGDLRGERDQLTSALEGQIGGVVDDATDQITSLFSDLTGGLGGLGGLSGLVGGEKTSDVLEGNKFNWDGQLSMGNKNMTILEAYEDLHAQVMELTNIVLQLTITVGGALAPPGAFGGPLISATEGLVSLSASRISLQLSGLMAKNTLNKLKLRRMLK